MRPARPAGGSRRAAISPRRRRAYAWHDPVPGAHGLALAPLGEGVRLLQAASQQLRFPQREATDRLKDYHFHCSRLFHRLREQRHGVGDAPTQGIRRPQGRSHPGEKGREVRFLADAYGPFEQGECPVQVTLAEG